MAHETMLGEIFTFLGFCAGALVWLVESRRKNLDTQGFHILALCGVFAGVVGARLTQIFADGTSFEAILSPQNGGKSLLGGLIFGWLGVEIAKWRLGIRRSSGDLWALALPLGEAVGRLGCHFNGCCTGIPFGGGWAIFQGGAWRHPAPIYSALGALLLFVLLWNLREKLPNEGDLFRLYLLLYGLSRFGIEFLRERDIVWGALSIVQIGCLGLVFYAFGSFRARQTATP